MWLYLSGLGLFNTFKLLELALSRRIIDRLVLISSQAFKDTVCVCFTGARELTTKALAQPASQTPVPLVVLFGNLSVMDIRKDLAALLIG